MSLKSYTSKIGSAATSRHSGPNRTTILNSTLKEGWLRLGQEQPNMPGKGRPFQKGVSGNPGGRPRQDPEVRALCEKFTPAAIATLAEIMGNKKAQPSARVAAAMAILKKTLPDLASIEHTGDGPRPFAVIPEVIESAAEWEAKFKPKTEH